jgi:UDP-hydrolysing UDP-N-acetyl-D-glucosamine 2-epimerase
MKVAVVTGSRADYGLLRPTLDALRADPGFEPCLLVTAMHLDPLYGDTLAEIEADGHAIAAHVPAGVPVHAAGDFARNLGRATIAFSEALVACAPDVLLLLGDRFESLAAALAATGLGLPVAHLHGGELSEGSLDDALRHCITKLSHLHLVATRAYAERVCQLGENPASVHLVGAAGLESIRRVELLDRGALAQALALERLPAPLLALTLHPESLDPTSSGGLAEALTGAVDEVLQGRGSVVVTLPNDDPGHVRVRAELTSWARARAAVHVFPTLGQRRYLSLLSHADVVLGNSSSAIIEASSFRVPVVNVGERQRGRLTAANTLSCRPEQAAIAAALRTALDPAFRISLGDLENPYDHGDVSARVVAALAAVPLADLLSKRFFDLPDAPWRTQLDLPRPPVASAEAAVEHTDAAVERAEAVAHAETR